RGRIRGSQSGSLKHAKSEVLQVSGLRIEIEQCCAIPRGVAWQRNAQWLELIAAAAVPSDAHRAPVTDRRVAAANGDERVIELGGPVGRNGIKGGVLCCS